jgi:hypothetical protein
MPPCCEVRAERSEQLHCPWLAPVLEHLPRSRSSERITSMALRRDRLDGRPKLLRRLARHLYGVRGNAAPFDGPLQYVLEHRHRLADRLDAHALRFEVGAIVCGGEDTTASSRSSTSIAAVVAA